MGFDFVWGTVEIKGTPPTGTRLHIGRDGYTFYPFSHDGPILTIDAAVWNVPGSKEPGNLRIVHWPNAANIADTFATAGSFDDWHLIAVSDSPVAHTIDPNDLVNLCTLPPLSTEGGTQNFYEAGFDVIDLSGLSALTDVGYTADDIAELRPDSFAVNENGLISSIGESRRFAEVASRLVLEHAPFFPVKILVRRRVTGSGMKKSGVKKNPGPGLET